jgi:hypothetical protein
MGFEIKDRRAEKAAAEAAAPMEPEVFAAGLGGALEAAVAGGDVVEINRVSAECGGGPEHKVVEFKKTVRGEVQTWKSVGYLPVFLPVGGQQVLMIQAVGLRTDDRLFTANYALPPMWEVGDDYMAAAKDRLDSFKACSCDDRGRCKFHGEAMMSASAPGKWLESDLKRLKKFHEMPMPEAVEVLMRGMQEAAQRRIVTPAEAAKGMIQ